MPRLQTQRMRSSGPRKSKKLLMSSGQTSRYAVLGVLGQISHASFTRSSYLRCIFSSTRGTNQTSQNKTLSEATIVKEGWLIKYPHGAGTAKRRFFVIAKSMDETKVVSTMLVLTCARGSIIFRDCIHRSIRSSLFTTLLAPTSGC